MNGKIFDCGDKDLNEFFSEDFIDYNNGLFGKTYCFTEDTSGNVVCAFSVSNDSIKNTSLPNAPKRKIRRQVAHSKHFLKSYPAVLVGRLGVSNNFSKKGVGKDLMDFIKGWFVHPGNKTGCRFIVVDAYNKDYVLNYYGNNGFKFLFTKEADEAEFIGLERDIKLDSRIMFFDLITLKAVE